MNKKTFLPLLITLTLVLTGCNLQPRTTSVTPTPLPDQQTDTQTPTVTAEKLELTAEVLPATDGHYTLNLYLNPITPSVSFDTFQLYLQIPGSAITNMSNPTLSSTLNQAGWNALLANVEPQTNATNLIFSGVYINETPYLATTKLLLSSSTFELTSPVQALNITIDAENTTFFIKGEEIEIVPPLNISVPLP